MPTEDLWLERDGARLRWRREGPAGAGSAQPTLLLLHGWALDLRLWDLVAAPLARHSTLLRFDRRGFGHSTGEPSLRSDAEDALAVLDAAGVERCALVGMSQGARVAATLARQFAQRCSHVILDGAPALANVLDEDLEEEVPLAEYQALLAQSGLGALRAAIARHALLQLVRPGEPAAALLAQMLRDYPGTDLQHHAPARAGLPAPRGQARRPPALGILQPTLVLNGARDSAVRKRIGTALAAHIPGARHVLLADTGHLACLDDPAGYARCVSEFIATG